MATSPSSLADNLAERPHKCQDCKSDLEYVVAKYNIPGFTRVEWNKKYEKEFGKDLTKIFEKLTDSVTDMLNKFFWCCGKVFFHISTWIGPKGSMKCYCQAKKKFYSNLTMKYITDAAYKYKRRASENFKVQNLGGYHDLYVHSDALPLRVTQFFRPEKWKLISVKN